MDEREVFELLKEITGAKRFEEKKEESIKFLNESSNK